jgi:hypothetical protein
VQVRFVVTIVPIFGDGMPQITVGQSAVNALVEAYNFISIEVFPAFDKLNGAPPRRGVSALRNDNVTRRI